MASPAHVRSPGKQISKIETETAMSQSELVKKEDQKSADVGDIVNSSSAAHAKKRTLSSSVEGHLPVKVAKTETDQGVHQQDVSQDTKSVISQDTKPVILQDTNSVILQGTKTFISQDTKPVIPASLSGKSTVAEVHKRKKRVAETASDFHSPLKKIKTEADEAKLETGDAKKKQKRRMKFLLQAVQDQIEFYFGDSNLSKDRYLKEIIDASAGGYVDLSVFATFNKLQSLHKNGVSAKVIINAVKRSKMLEVDDDETKVRRITPFNKIGQEETDSRTVYVEHLPSHATHQWVKTVFSQCGRVVYVSLPTYKYNKNIKGFAFVEFDSSDEAAKACSMLNNPAPAKSEEKPGKFPRGNKTLNRLQRLVPAKLDQDSNEENMSDELKVDAGLPAGGLGNKKKKKKKGKRKKTHDGVTDDSNVIVSDDGSMTVTEQTERKKKKKKKKRKQNVSQDKTSVRQPERDPVSMETSIPDITTDLMREMQESPHLHMEEGVGTHKNTEGEDTHMNIVGEDTLKNVVEEDTLKNVVGEDTQMSVGDGQISERKMEEADDKREEVGGASGLVEGRSVSSGQADLSVEEIKLKKKRKKHKKKRGERSQGEATRLASDGNVAGKGHESETLVKSEGVVAGVQNSGRKERKLARQADIRQKKQERERLAAGLASREERQTSEVETSCTGEAKMETGRGELSAQKRKDGLGSDSLQSSEVTDSETEDVTKGRRKSDGSELTSILKSSRGQERKKVEFDPVPITTEFIKGREIRKRKKPKREKLHLRVITKKEWLSLKAEYIARQKSHMAALKESLRELRQQENRGREDMALRGNRHMDLEDVFGTKRLKPSQDVKMAHVEALKFTPNVIVQWKCSHEMHRDKIRTLFKEMGGDSIAYIDAKEEAKSGYIRFKDEASAEEFTHLSRRSTSFMTRILPADQQQAYWDKANEDRMKKLAHKKQEKGSERIARKVFERNKATFHQKPSRIVFNDDDEDDNNDAGEKNKSEKETNLEQVEDSAVQEENKVAKEKHQVSGE